MNDPLPGNLPLNKKDPRPSEKILELACLEFGLNDIQFVRKMENSVFSAKKADQDVFLRLTSRMRRNPSQIQAELKWITDLKKSGFLVPRIIPSKNGSLSMDISLEHELFHAALFEKIPGKHPSQEKFKDMDFLYSLGQLIGELHLHNEGMEYAALDREPWHEERGTRFAKSFAARGLEQLCSQSFHDSLTWMSSLEKNKYNYGLVHGDLNLGNLFLTDTNDIYMIDFDDSCFHWYIIDLAIVMMPLALEIKGKGDSDIEKQALCALLSGYRSVRFMDQSMVELMPKFMDFLFLRLILWISEHEYLDTFEEETWPRVQSFKMNIYDVLKERDVFKNGFYG